MTYEELLLKLGRIANVHPDSAKKMSIQEHIDFTTLLPMQVSTTIFRLQALAIAEFAEQFRGAIFGSHQ